MTFSNNKRFLVDFSIENIEFTHKIDRKITFHDSCAWRKLDEEVYDGPRQLLEIMGADLVEMEHNRNKSLCCGAPLAARNPQLADEFAEISKGLRTNLITKISQNPNLLTDKYVIKNGKVERL
ncbi:MAG: hypothetical protein GY866_40780 [Proteobacteria bacterium]|nr:hypothetical protein [Pseudomonadota bacterium]